MTCASCGRTNRDDSRFCVGCGTALVARCPACGREAESDARFCGGCGSPLAAVAPAAAVPPAAPVSEPTVARKTVTIVFADLAGSTALHERLDAESARALMDRYYRTLHAVVDAHGGTVVKLLGDGVMVAFGVPRVAEDDAIRAVRAAVGMQQAFRTLADGQAAALGAMSLRVAVNTGEVVVSGAHDDVVGDPVNVAARLQQEAHDGDVLIGEATRRLVSDLVTLELFGSLTLKGRSETVAAYRVVSLERPAGAPALAFVGRDDELRRLTAVYDATVAARAARLAVILGSPGLGKSRLVGELVRRVGDDATVVSAHCDATGGATFAPLADGLRALLRLDAAADGDIVRAAIEDGMGADAPDRPRIAAGVAALLAGAPAAPEETFFVIRRFLAALGAGQPVVLVIDDLQGAEPLLLDHIEHLVQRSTDVPLLVLVAARPELRDARSSLAVLGGGVTDVVTLAGLDAGAATRLAANAIGADELPAAVAGRVLAISEGNPLFVGELVRMLVQDGALKREGDRWTTAVELSTLAMPPTIHALLAARIERLRPEERAVLERAAIVGRQFSRTAVAHLLPSATGNPNARDASDLDARLESLRRSELIEPDTGWFLGEPALTFHHGLIRDAAYRRILKGTRAELHERFADWLASRVGTSIEHDDTMGWHLEQAHQHLRELGPIDAHGRTIGERAARHLAAAGRRALERDDLPLAGSLLGRAVDRLDPADPTRADLALDWCEALLTAGDVGPAAAAVAELSRFMAGSPRLAGWHTCFAGQLAALTDPATLRGTADAVAGAATTLASLDDAAGEAKAHAVHATALARLGEIGACEAALDRALAAARRAGDRRRANAVLAGAPVAALWGPSPVTRASGRCLDVVRVLRITQGAPAVEAVALRCQAVLEALRGRAGAARRMIAASRHLVEELGITQRLLEAEVSTGLIELLEGDAVAAERALHPAYDGLRRHGLGIDAAQAAALLGRALLAQGRAAEAEALSHESELLAGDDLKAAIAWRGVRAEALARRGEHGEAIAFAHAAVAIAAATDALLDHADARLALAAALRAAGKGAEADAEEARAIALWEAKGATLLAERARHDGARLDPAAAAPGDRVKPAPPVPRRVGANAATTNTARYGAALNACNVEDCIALTADDYVAVHNVTGLRYDRAAALARLRAVFKSRDLVIAQEPLATLGDSLVLFRQLTSSSGASGGTFDVGPYDLENICLNEVDAHGRRRRFEQFADDHLGDAIVRLYERYAEILPDGPARTRAAATAGSVAAHMAPFDFERLATTFAADIAVVDHRTVGFGTLHGAERLRPALQAFLDLIDGFAWRAVDVLALEAEAFLFRYVGSGTERVGGLPYERTQLELMVFGADGSLARWERFDVEHAPAALARFETLAGGLDAQRPVRRVRANAASAILARFEAAFAAGDADAIAALWTEGLEVVDHPNGAAYGREGHLVGIRRLQRSREPRLRFEPLATLEGSLCLARREYRGSGSDYDGDFDIGAFEREVVVLFETVSGGRCARVEVFAIGHLGDAVARLYARHAELNPDGPTRARAAATARAVAAMVASPDLERYASALAPDVAFVDHRTVGFASGSGADTLLLGFRSLFELADELTTRVEDVLRLEPDAVLLRWTVTGVDRATGGAFESEFLLLWVFGPDGRVGHDETFDAHRAAEAMARFDALVGGTAATSTAELGTTPFENAATENTRRLSASWHARDWPGLLARLPAEFRYVDRRPMAQLELDRHGYVEFIRQLGDMRSVRVEGEMIATRGDRLALGRLQVEVAGGDVGPSEVEFFDVIETNDRGETVARVRFDPADLDAAYAELDARYAAGEAAAHALVSAWLRAFRGSVVGRDWDALAGLAASTFVAHDHRLIGWGTLAGPVAWLQALQSLVELMPDVRYRQDHVRISDRGYLGAITWVGTRDGGLFEIPAIAVWELDDLGKQHRLDLYEVHHLDQARARFAAIGGPSAATPATPFANAAARAWDRSIACWQSRDWPRYRQLLTVGFRCVDRRRMALLELDGDQFVEFTRQLADMRSVRVDTEVLATRGDRLALIRVRTEVAGGEVGPSEANSCHVSEIDERGLITTFVRFDLDDLDAAYAELDARFDAGEAAAHPLARELLRRLARLFTIHDWDGLVACCAPSFVAHDHRLVSWGTLNDGAAWVHTMRTLVDLAPDSHYRRDHVRISDRGSLAVGGWVGMRDGGLFEIATVTVNEVDEYGRILRLDVYEHAQLDQALARFAAIGSNPAVTPALRFANAATRAWGRAHVRYQARDWSGMALQVFSERFRYTDRRRMALLDLDRDGFIELTRQLGDMRSAELAHDVLATRGERLALLRIRLEVADADVGPSEVVNLNLVETDEHGQFVTWVRFDPDDLDAAHAELEARFEAGEGLRYSAAVTANRAIRDTGTQHDWEALTAALAPTFSADDHRLLGWGTTLADRATFVRSQQALAELAPDFRLRAEHLRISDRGFFVQGAQYGTREGGAFESPLLAVAEVDAAGLVLHYDLYDVDDYEQARARFDALGARATPVPSTPFVPKPNTATASMERTWAAFDVGDLDAVRALCATGFQWDDRRPLVGMSGDVELMIASARERLAIGSHLEKRVVIGTAGNRIAIARVLWAGGPPEGRFEVEYLALHEVDEAGLCRALIFFDVDDEFTAKREARDRWLAIDPVAAAVVGAQARFIDAWNDCDRARVRATLADDLIVDDHRRTGMGRIDDVEVYVDSIVALWQLAPDARIESWSWLAVEPHGGVFVGRRAGQLPEGGAFESEYLGVIIVRRGLTTRIEMFELDAVDAALARFAELRPDLLRIPPNAATRANDRYYAYGRTGDWEGLRAHYNPACVFENRRRLLRTSGGIEMAIANARHLWEPGVDAERTVLATAGDRLALEHWRWTGRERDVLLWERESLTVGEVDAEGRILAVVIFDVEDRVAASDELAERHARSSFPPAVANRFVEMRLARRARDIPRLRATFPDDFYFDDHRRTGFGRLEGPDAYMDSLVALYEQSPDVTVGEPLYSLAAESYGALGVGHTFGTLNDGGAFESVFLQLGLYGANGLHGVELFELEDIDRARARFAELRPDLLRIPPNAATRAWDRWERLATAGDWDAVRAAHYVPSYRCEDRRRLFRITLGLDETLQSDRHVIENGWRSARTLLATAGDRLALQRVMWSLGDESGRSEVEMLSIEEVDREGHTIWAAFFDPEDRAAASDELAERYARMKFPPAATDRAVEVIRARRSRDLARIRAALPAEFHLDDHRHTGLGRIAGAEAYTAALAALFEQSPDVTVGPLHYLAEETYGALCVTHTFGTLNNGGEFESVFLTVVLYGDDGPLALAVEAFELEDLDRARARFEELRPEPLRIPPNAATHAIARSNKAISAADSDAVRALVRDDFVFEDSGKRALVRGDIETWLGSMQFIAALPEIRIESEIIATLGERIALQRVVVKGGPEGGEFELLHCIRLFVVDAAGRLGTVIIFDLDDRKLAFVEALERFAAGEAAETGGVAPFAAFVRAFAAYDWEAARRTLAPDFVLDDHRTLGLGRLDGDQWIASMQAQAALGPGVAEVRRILAWNRHGLAVELRTAGTVDGGGPFENLMITVLLISGDGIRSGASFDLTDADRALAWFAEQTSTESTT